MIQKEGNYISGTSAKKLKYYEKLKYDVYEENKLLKAKKKARSYIRTKLKIVCFVLAVFACCFTMIYRYALITDLSYTINKLEKCHNELMNENSRIKIDLERKTDLNRIKEMAQSKLNMQEPDRYQIVYISIPKDDFTTVAETYKNKERTGSSMLVLLVEKVGRLARLLY